MARTTLSNVFVPETFASYQIEDPVTNTDFAQSGVVSVDGALNAYADSAGFITTVPFWKPLDTTAEPNYGNDVYTDVADPNNIQAGEQIARISDLNEGWSAARLVAALAGRDPMKQIASEVDRFWAEQFQTRVLAITVGLYNDNKAANGGDMVIDISSANNTVTDANRFSSDAIVNATLTMGDAMKKITAMAVHSVVYGKMIKNDMIDFVADSEGKLTIPTYMGKRVVVTDAMPIIGGDGSTVAFKYLSVLFGAGAIGYGMGTPDKPTELDSEPARGNGAGFETLWSRKRWLIHPFGYKFNSTTITGPGLSPTWADLKSAANWERVVNRKNVPLAFLVTNG